MPHRSLVLLIGLVLCACAKAPDHPVAGTPAAALGAWQRQVITVAQEVPLDQDRIVLFRTDQHPTLQITLLYRHRSGGWEARDPVGYSEDLPRSGPVTFMEAHLGRIEERHGDGLVTVRGRELTVYGEVSDPAITWVEITLPGDTPRRVPVVGGTWLVHVPDKPGTPPFPKFSLRAGFDDKVVYQDADPWETQAKVKRG